MKEDNKNDSVVINLDDTEVAILIAKVDGLKVTSFVQDPETIVITLKQPTKKLKFVVDSGVTSIFRRGLNLGKLYPEGKICLTSAIDKYELEQILEYVNNPILAYLEDYPIYKDSVLYCVSIDKWVKFMKPVALSNALVIFPNAQYYVKDVTTDLVNSKLELSLGKDLKWRVE